MPVKYVEILGHDGKTTHTEKIDYVYTNRTFQEDPNEWDIIFLHICKEDAQEIIEKGNKYNYKVGEFPGTENSGGFCEINRNKKTINFFTYEEQAMVGGYEMCFRDQYPKYNFEKDQDV